MIGKKNAGRIFGLCLATIYAPLITFAFRGFLPRMQSAITVLLFIILGIGLYFAGVWVMVERPAQLDKKIPISSKELRRRTREFYDWLASQGRH